MRILHVINSIGVREGAELSLMEILVGTSREFDHKIAVLTDGDPPVVDLEEAGIETIKPSSPLSSRLAQVRYVHAAVKQAQPDLIHASLFDADQAARLAGLVAGVPVLSSLVNMPYSTQAMQAETAATWKLRIVRQVDGLSGRWLNAGFHAITQATADHAMRHLRLDPSNVRVVARGRSRQRLGEPTCARRQAVRLRMGWDERPIILSVARQEPQKGQRSLLEALPRILTNQPSAQVVLVGRSGRSTPELTASVQSLGLEQHVAFLDVREDVPDLMAGADVLAFPSLYEGLGGAVIEAMALELPVVAFDTPAVREALGQGSCGMLTPVGRSDLFADEILRILNEPSTMKSTTKDARRRFDEVYELGACLDGMSRLYRDVAVQLPLKRGRKLNLNPVS